MTLDPRTWRGLLVLGAPRSGTTLIASALGAHPGIAMLLEEWNGSLFRMSWGKLPAVKLVMPEQIQLAHRGHRLYNLAMRSSWVRRRIGHRLPRSRLSLRDMATRGELAVVCVLRDPGANVEALEQRHARPPAIAREIVAKTYDVFEALPEPGLTPRFVSFDRFVTGPEDQLRALCDWLRLPFHPGMLAAPMLNAYYPDTRFRSELAVSETAAPDPGEDRALARLRTRHRALLARAQ
jgi:hypothetical protein